MGDWTRMNRRGFLAHVLRTLCATAGSGPALRAAAVLAMDAPASALGLSTAQWQTLAAVQEHLLPSESVGSPGAREVNASGYLRLVLMDPRLELEERRLVSTGLVEFETLCAKRYGTGFPDLDPGAREEALRAFEQLQTGQQWLGEILDFLLEALLGDPSYGGNPDGIGWHWLQITPGFPRPGVTAEGSPP